MILSLLNWNNGQTEVRARKGDTVICLNQNRLSVEEHMKKKYLQYHTSSVNLSPLSVDTHRLFQPAAHCANTVTFTKASLVETSQKSRLHLVRHCHDPSLIWCMRM